MGSDFPYADEAALRAVLERFSNPNPNPNLNPNPDPNQALERFYASAAYAQLEAQYEQYASRTGFLTDGEGGIKAQWNAF